MAKWGGLKLTVAGHDLLGDVLAGNTELHFTRVMSGDGFLSDGADIYEMTDLVSPVKEFPIASVRKTGVGKAVIVAQYSNENQDFGYYVREIGLFAQDPNKGEILYAYANAGQYCDYLVGSDGPDLVQALLVLNAVIDQAEKVTAVISADLIFITHEELERAILDLFGPSAPIAAFWTRTHGDDRKLRPVTLDDVKLAVLGDGIDLPRTTRKVENLEDIVAQMLLEIEAREMYPDYTRMMVEDFLIPDNVDLFKTRVLTVFAGDTSIDVEDLDGIIPRSWYTLTDGVRQELVCVKSVNLEQGVRRVMLTAPIQHTYIVENTRLHRSSATVKNNMACGPIGIQNVKWDLGLDWRGLNADTPVTSTLPTNLANVGRFALSGAVGFTSDGLVMLA